MSVLNKKIKIHTFSAWISVIMLVLLFILKGAFYVAVGYLFLTSAYFYYHKKTAVKNLSGMDKKIEAQYDFVSRLSSWSIMPASLLFYLLVEKIDVLLLVSVAFVMFWKIDNDI